MAEEQRTTVLDIAGPTPSDRDPKAACLVVIYGDELGKRVALGPDKLTCGREAENAVQLDDERVSRRHAEIVWNGSDFVVIDQGSTNGTFINNVAIERTKLRHGDQLKIGRTIFKFLHGNTAEAQYHEVIYQLMTNDGLTKAYNKRYFEQALQREISRARRYRRPLGLLLLDLDHFKRINDEHGHMAGDEVLRQFAGLVSRSIRREDLLGRIGGEEFAVLIPEGTTAGAQLFAERLRELVNDAAFEFEGEQIRVTCSFGFAELPAADLDPEQTAAAMYKNADRRLYAAKKAGRNRVVVED